MDWSFVDSHQTRSYNHTNLLLNQQSDPQILAVSARRFTRGDLLFPLHFELISISERPFVFGSEIFALLDVKNIRHI